MRVRSGKKVRQGMELMEEDGRSWKEGKSGEGNVSEYWVERKGTVSREEV